MPEYYLGIFIWVIIVVVCGALCMGIYSTIKHFKIKEQQIKLEKERLVLERRKLDEQK